MAYPALDHRIGKLVQSGIKLSDVSQRRHPEQLRGLLTTGSAGSIFAVDQCMGGLGIQHQDLQAGSCCVESNLLSVVGPAVEEECVAGCAQRSGGLVHEACRRPDEGVLRVPGELGAVQSSNVEVVEVGQS